MDCICGIFGAKEKRAISMDEVQILYDSSAAPEIEGGQKKIFRGKIRTGGTSKPCAVAKPGFGYKQGIIEEVQLWQSICEPGHESILRLYHFNRRDMVIAMELINPIGFDLVALGTQYSYDGGKMMPVAETADIFRKLCGALRYLHDAKQVLHRDLKADQVLITPAQEVKLTDFGLAVTMEDIRTKPSKRCMCRNPGPSNIAPEIPPPGHPDPKPYNGQVDLFGLGWILGQLYSQLFPRTGAKLSERLLQSECGEDAVARKELADIVETRLHLIKVDPSTRMTLSQLEDRNWMKSARVQSFQSSEEAHTIMGRVETKSRSLLRRFGRRLVAASALLQPPFPSEGMLLKDVLSGDWTCLLIEKPDNSFQTLPIADTRLQLRQRIFFGCKESASVEVTCATEEEVQALTDKLDDEGHLTGDVTVGGRALLKGFDLRKPGDSKPAVGVAVTFDYDPKLELSRKLNLDFSETLARSEHYHALSPFSLEFDAFEFPARLVTPSAILGPEEFKTDNTQIALNFRKRFRVNLAGIASPCKTKQSGIKIEWMPGPRSVLVPGSFGLVVRRPTKSGISLPTVTDADLKNEGLAP